MPAIRTWTDPELCVSSVTSTFSSALTDTSILNVQTTTYEKSMDTRMYLYRTSSLRKPRTNPSSSSHPKIKTHTRNGVIDVSPYRSRTTSASRPPSSVVVVFEGTDLVSRYFSDCWDMELDACSKRIKMVLYLSILRRSSIP